MSKKTTKYVAPDFIEVSVCPKTVFATSGTFSDGSAEGIDELYEL